MRQIHHQVGDGQAERGTVSEVFGNVPFPFSENDEHASRTSATEVLQQELANRLRAQILFIADGLEPDGIEFLAAWQGCNARGSSACRDDADNLALHHRHSSPLRCHTCTLFRKSHWPWMKRRWRRAYAPLDRANAGT